MKLFQKSLLCGLSTALLIMAADAPAEVDAALRARVEEFYKLQAERKFRQAEDFVASDTKDFYYEMRKPEVGGFTIQKIEYEAGLQKAKVTISTQTQLRIPGAAPIAMTVPVPTTWKIEDGKWCWYMAQDYVDTPFGRVKVAKPDPASAKAAANVAARVSAASAMNGVHSDVARIQLDPLNPSPRTVNLKNTLPGPVTIQSMTSSPALKIEIGKPELGADESTTVTITPVAGAKDHPAQLVLKVGPIGQMINIAIDYPAN